MNVDRFYQITRLPKLPASLSDLSPSTSSRTSAQLELFEEAKLNPWRLFTSEEIAEIFHLNRGRIRRAKEAADTPFRFNKCRPEDFLLWLKQHPELKEDKLASPHRTFHKKSGPKQRQA